MNNTVQAEVQLRRSLKTLNDLSQEVGHVCILFCVAVYYLTLFSEIFFAFAGRELFDYGSLYASLDANIHHLNPYLNYAHTFHLYLGIRGVVIDAVNLNPPISLFLFRPLAALEPHVGIWVWSVISVCLFCISLLLVACTKPIPASKTRLLVAIGMAGVWHTFHLGQVYMVLLFLTAVAWVLLKNDNRTMAGITIGLLCALKPNFLIWPVLLILARHRKVGVSAIFAFAGVSLIPVIVGDASLYVQWISACRHFNGLELEGNSAILAMFSRADPYMSASHHLRTVGAAVTAIIVFVAALFMVRKAPDMYITSEIALLLCLLVGPITWVGYTVVLIPILYKRQLNSLLRLGWVLLCIPFFLLPATARKSSADFVLMGSPYFYGLLLIGTGLLHELRHEHGERNLLEVSSNS